MDILVPWVDSHLTWSRPFKKKGQIRCVISQNLVKIKWFNFSSFFQWLCHFIPANGAHMPVFNAPVLGQNTGPPLHPHSPRPYSNLSPSPSGIYLPVCGGHWVISCWDSAKGNWRQGFLMSSEKLLRGSAKASLLQPPIPTSRREWAKVVWLSVGGQELAILPRSSLFTTGL